LTKGAVDAVPGGEDGDSFDLAAGVEEGDDRRLVIPDFGMAVPPANDDGGEGGLLQAEAEMFAVAGLRWAVTAQVGGDLVISQDYPGADDAAVIRNFPISTSVPLHDEPPLALTGL